MNPVPFILLAISLPLLLGGCGEKATVEPVAEVKPVEEKVIEVKFIEFKEIEKRDDGLWYRKTVETPYSGGAFTLYSDGKKKSESIFKDGLLDGVMRGWYANDQKGTEINYKNGKIHGLKIGWHSNGNKASEAHFKHGKKHGVETEWFPSGVKQVEINFNNGKLDGTWTSWTEKGTKFAERTFDHGKPLSLQNWNEKGELRMSLKETDYTPVGTANFAEIEKRKDGLHYKRGDESPYSGKAYEASLFGNKKKEGSFKNGLKDGLWIEWNEQHKKRSQIPYREGELHGISVHWGPVNRELYRYNYENGEKIELPEKTAGLVNLSELTMRNHGLSFPASNKPFSGEVFSLHHSNGEKLQQGTLVEGKEDGVWLEWDDMGVKRHELTYSSGRLLRALAWKPNQKKPENGIINGSGILKNWYENGKLAFEKKFIDGNELLIRRWDSDGKFKGSKFSDYYRKLDKETKKAEYRIEFAKKHILNIENEMSKDEARKHFKEDYLELSELEKKLIQITTEISSIKAKKEQWDSEMSVVNDPK